jgi:hypothetical protein
MAKLLLIFTLACASANAAINIYPSASRSMTAAGPTGDLTISMRVHITGGGPLQSTSYVYAPGGYYFGIVYTSGSSVQTTYGGPDTTPGAYQCYTNVNAPSDYTDITDIEMVITRSNNSTEIPAYFLTGGNVGAFYGTTYNVQTGQQIGQTCKYPLTALAPAATIKGAGITIGSNNTLTTMFIDNVRGSYEFTDPATVPHPFISGNTDWFDYEFASSGTVLVDSAGGQTLTGGSVTYAPTVTYNVPVCAATINSAIQPNFGSTVLVGQSLVPTGANSYPLDGGSTLTYTWTYAGTGSDGVNQPSISIASGTTVTPTVTGITNFGSVNLQLVVHDGSSNPATCVGHYGAAIYNPTTYLINQTSEGLTTAQQTIIGPQVAFGHSGWPFADTLLATQAILQNCQLQSACNLYGASQGSGAYYPFWISGIQAGCTLSITGGSNTVTFTGCNAQTIFCSGTTTPSLSGIFAGMVYTGTDGFTNHLMIFQPTACPTSSTITLSFTYPTTPNSANNPGVVPGGAWWPTCSPCSGMAFSTFAQSLTGAYFNYNNGGSPFNYYDVVLAGMLGYWRSGIDTFYSLANTIATYSLTNEDYYQGCNSVTNNTNPGGLGIQCSPSAATKNIPILGMIAWEQFPGNSYSLPAIENAISLFLSQVNQMVTNGACDDTRECSYRQSGVSMMAFADSTYAATYRTAIKNVMAMWSGSQVTTPFVGWNMFYSNPNPTLTSVGGSGGSVCTLNNGTNTIIYGVGTSLALGSGSQNTSFWTFPAPAATVPAYNGTYWNTGGGVQFGDPLMYSVASVSTYSSGAPSGCTGATQTITLNQIYNGTTGNFRGYVSGLNSASGILGYGFQPYMETLLGISFWHNYLTLVACGSSCTSQAALALAYSHSQMNLVASISPTDLGGFTNGIYFPGCPPSAMALPSSASSPILPCYGITGTITGNPALDTGLAQQTRQLSIEAARLCAIDQGTNPGVNLTFCKKIMSEMFATPIVVNTLGPAFDNIGYLNQLDFNGLPWYNSGYNVNAPNGSLAIMKWAGQCCGFSEAPGTLSGILAQQAALPNLTISGPVTLSGPIVLQ